MTEPVVVSGSGLVCSLGSRIPRVWRDALAGRTDHLRRRPWLDSSLPPVGMVPSFSRRRVLDRRRARLVTREVVLGFAAAGRAVRDAGFADGIPPAETGCIAGAPTNLGDPSDLVDALHASVGAGGRFDTTRFGSEGVPRIHPMSLIKALSNGLLCYVTMEHRLTGFNTNICSGAIASSLAVGRALRLIRDRRLRRALVVGYDGVGSAIMQLPHERRRRPDTVFAPFVHQRRGVLPGEAGAAVVLEPLSDARRRGAKPLVEVAGFGESRARRRGSACPQAMREALGAALDDAGCDWKELDYVHVDGWGGRQEWQALARGLDGRPRSPLVSSTTPATGHAPAAGGLLGTLFAGLAARSGIVPPTAGRRPRGIRAPLATPRSARRHPVALAGVLTRDASGEYAALLLRRCGAGGHR